MRSRLGFGALLRRQLVADRAVGLVVVLVVVAVAGLVAAWPRVIEQIFTDDLHESVEAESPRLRDLVSVSPFGVDSPDPLLSQGELEDPSGLQAADVFGDFDEAIEALRASQPEPLRSALQPAQYVLSGPEIRFGDRAEYWPEEIRNGDLTLHADPDFLDRIELVTGSEPGVEVRELDPEDVFGPPLDPAEVRFGSSEAPEGTRFFRSGGGDGGFFVSGFEPGETVRHLVIDIVMSSPTAEGFGWEIGEVRELSTGVDARLSGTFELLDPDDEYWVHQVSLLGAHEFVDFNVGTTIIGSAYIDPVALGYLIDADRTHRSAVPIPVTMRTWFPFDVSANRVGDAPEILDQARAFLAEPLAVDHRPGTPSAQTGQAITLRFSTSSTDLLESTLAAQAGAAALIAMVAAGPLGATIAVLALAVKLLIERRRTAFALVEARGAAPRQLRLALVVEGMLLGVPAALAATYAVQRVLPGEGGFAGWTLPALIGLTPMVLLPLLVRPSGLGGRRRDIGRLRAGWLRWTADILVVGTAATALWLLNRRGLAAGAVTSGVDPLLAATPLLLALAACVVILRLYPIPVALLARLWRARPGLVSYVGAARAVRDPAGGLAAVLALVVGLAVGVLSTVLWASTERGVDAAAEETVGADMRADGPAFTQAELDAVAALPGVTAATGISSLGRVALSSSDGRSDTVDVYVADLAALEHIQDGFADPLNVPALQAGADAVPAIASRGVGDIGDGGSLSQVRTFDIRIVGHDTDIPGVRHSDRWVLLDLTVLRESVDTVAGLRPRTLLIGTAGEVDALRESVAAVLPPQTQLTSLDDAATDATGGAIGSGMQAAFTVAAVVGGALAATAMVITMVIAAPARGRLFSQLRTLGLSARQARGLATWELAPLTVTAVVTGGALGLAIPWLLLPSVDLRGLIGGSSQPGMAIDWMLVAGAVGAFVIVAILAMSVAVAASRRLRLGSVLRVGEEI